MEPANYKDVELPRREKTGRYKLLPCSWGQGVC